MKASATDIARLSAGHTSRGVNLAALGKGPAVSPDLALVLAAVESAGYGTASLEHPVVEGRKWAFDAAWPAYRVALEREGGRFVQSRCDCGKPYTRFVSRHHDKNGLEADAEKYNAGTAAGWAILRATPGMLADGRALAAVLATLARRATYNQNPTIVQSSP